MNSGFSLMTALVLMSKIDKISLNLHAVWPVWQSIIGVNPAYIFFWGARLTTNISATNFLVLVAGSFLHSETTKPLL